MLIYLHVYLCVCVSPVPGWPHHGMVPQLHPHKPTICTATSGYLAAYPSLFALMLHIC